VTDVRNCRRCGKIFTYTGSSVCPSCKRGDQEEFRKIRDYLFEHPNSSSIEVSEATGISVKLILSYLREGRLESDLPNGTASSGKNGFDYVKEGNYGSAPEVSTGLVCEFCGRPIKIGRVCGICEKVY